MRVYSILFAALGLGLFSCSGENPIPVDTYFQGKSIYLSSDIDGKHQIYRWTPDSLVRIVFEPDFHFWWPRCQPNGDRMICFKGPLMNGLSTSTLWRFKKDGSEGEQLIDPSEYGWFGMTSANYSPDGRWIILAAEVMDSLVGDERWHLFVCDSLGDNPKRITPWGRMYYDPSFSKSTPLGIIYSAWPEGTLEPFTYNIRWSLEVHTAKIDTSVWQIEEEVRLTDDDVLNSTPMQTSNGQRIVFSFVEDQINPSTKTNIRSVWTNGTENVELLRDGRANYNPCWTPDDQNIVFQRGEFGLYSLYAIRSTGGGLVRILGDDNNNFVQPFVED